MSYGEMSQGTRKSVLVVSHYYTAHGGGVEKVAAALIGEISAVSNVNFTWCASDCDARPSPGLCEYIPAKSVNLLENAMGLPLPIWLPRGLGELKKAVKKADMVWLHDTLYMGNILAFFWAKKFKKPIIVTKHIGVIPYSNPLLRWAMRVADKYITLPMLKNADQAIFISDAVAEDYYKRATFDRPLVVIPNGVDLQTFFPLKQNERAYIRQQFVLKPDQPVFLFVGRFVERKGLMMIRRLAAMLPSCRFWLAGDGNINPAGWLLPNVHVFRGRTSSSLAELYHAADLLISPGYGEGFPLVIQEAFSCGLPVMCGNDTAAGCKNAQPYLYTAEVWPKDIRRTTLAWAKKLKSLPVQMPLKSPIYDLAEFAETNWSWHPIACAYTEIIEKLLDEKQAS